jgi:dienelactone hydrolase
MFLPQQSSFRVPAVIAGVLLLSLATSHPISAAAARVTFPSSDPAAKLRLGDIKLSAQLWKPAGNGPFASLIALHGCNGPREYEERWIERFVQWGYVVIRPNSLAARGLTTTCTSKDERNKLSPSGGKHSAKITKVNPQQRVHDTADALRYLRTLRFVDKRRVAVIGWSHGGETAFLSAEETFAKAGFDDIEEPLKGAISFYPRCYFVGAPKFKMPLLVLVGAVDQWADALSCQHHVKQRQSIDIPAEVVVYPNAYHGFDSPGSNVTVFGYRVLYNENAHRDSIERVKRFLADILRD